MWKCREKVRQGWYEQHKASCHNFDDVEVWVLMDHVCVLDSIWSVPKCRTQKKHQDLAFLRRSPACGASPPPAPAPACPPSPKLLPNDQRWFLRKKQQPRSWQRNLGRSRERWPPSRRQHRWSKRHCPKAASVRNRNRKHQLKRTRNPRWIWGNHRPRNLWKKASPSLLRGKLWRKASLSHLELREQRRSRLIPKRHLDWKFQLDSFSFVPFGPGLFGMKIGAMVIQDPTSYTCNTCHIFLGFRGREMLGRLKSHRIQFHKGINIDNHVESFWYTIKTNM